MARFTLSATKAGVRKLRRTVLLEMLARQSPEQLSRSSFKKLPAVVRRAQRQSVAWRTLLKEAAVRTNGKVDPAELLRTLPVVEKRDLFDRFSVGELWANDIPVSSLSGILTSSGHGGRSFAFGLISREQAEGNAFAIDVALQQAFGIDHRSTLLVNCLPMGVTFESDSVCVANVSVREDMALAILDQAGRLFEQVILCIDPLFGKRLLDYARSLNFDWASLRAHVILGEETFSEDFRSYLAATLGADIDSGDELATVIGSSMGVGELGLNLFFETTETIALRRTLHRLEPDQVQPSFFCFNPLHTLVEVHQPDEFGVGDLVITVLDAEAPIPMLRYSTGDRVRWLKEEDLQNLPATLRTAVEKLPLPVVAMLGRDRDQITPHWHIDHFKALLYRDAMIATNLSGAFHITSHVTSDDTLRWEVQLSPWCTEPVATVESSLQELVRTVANRLKAPIPDVVCFPFESFPHGMNLDYERKFRYYPRVSPS